MDEWRLALTGQIDPFKRSRSQKLLEPRGCRGTGEPLLQVATRGSRAQRVSQRLGEAVEERRVFFGDMKGDAGEGGLVMGAGCADGG